MPYSDLRTQREYQRQWSKTRRGKPKTKKTVPWNKVQVFYDLGNTVRDCCEKFDFCRASWTKAVNRGLVLARRNGEQLERLLTGEEKGTASTNRGNVKKKLLREGLLKNCCAVCGQEPSWRGILLVLVLDHTDGDKYNYERKNLRLLCPNCNSQMDTFSGRNRSRSGMA